MLRVTDTAGAWQDASRAAHAAGVEVRVPASLAGFDEARLVFDATWPALDGSTQVTPNLLRAAEHAGGYVATAYAGDSPIGAAFAFVGRHQDDAGTWHDHLHSHLAAVLPAHRDRHVGRALKLHQRAWAIEQGIDTVVWTFDPLVRRNVRLNLLHLGVEVDGFVPDFYGSLADGINDGDPTDRLFARWRLRSDRVARAVTTGLDPTKPAADDRVIALPPDIVAIRAADPGAASRWRMDVRHALLAAIGDGLTVVGISPGGDLVLGRTR